MMEILLVLIVITLIGYAIFDNSTKIKYQKACRLINGKEYIKAQSILKDLFEKHPEALTKYAESFFLLGTQENDISFYHKAIDCKAHLNPVSNRKTFELIESSALYEVCKIRYLEYIEKLPAPAIINLENNLAVFTSSNHPGKEKEFKELETQHHKSIALFCYKLAVEREKDNNLIGAIEFYDKTIAKKNNIGLTPNYYDAIIRKNICRLKQDTEISTAELDIIDNIKHPFNQELFYRYCIQQLKKGKIDLVEKYIDKITVRNSEVQLLAKAARYIRYKALKKDIIDLNERIENLYSNNGTDPEVLYNELARVSREVKSFAPGIYEELNNIKPSVLNRVLVRNYEKKNYDIILKYITEYPNFYNNYLLMKNLGNICFNIANEGYLNENNYKVVISSFLTTIYSDEVIIASLENTNWDDNYTFTLIDSLGTSKEKEDLPTNINYLDVSDTNVSIGDIQREILRLFEAGLKKNIKDMTFQNKVEQFYYSEKDALESILPHLSRSTCIASPFFSKQYHLNQFILDDLEDEFSNYDVEEVLEIGIYYLTGVEDGIIAKYQVTKNLMNDIFSLIKTHNSKLLLTKKVEIDRIIEYESLKSRLEDEILKILHLEIEKSPTNEGLLDLYNTIFKLISTSDKLNFQYVNYVTSLCLTKVFEEKTLSNVKALEYMTEAYFRVPDNFNLCKYLVLLINNNLFDIINQNTHEDNKIFKLLEKVNNHKSRVFLQNASLLDEARANLARELPVEFWNAARGGNLNYQGMRLLSCMTQMMTLSNKG